MRVKYKLNKEGVHVTPCPHGFTTFTGNRLKRVGKDCLFCQYREHVDYDNQEVICKWEKAKPKGGTKPTKRSVKK